MNLATRLRQARSRAGLTIRGLAKELGISHAAVGHWETGRHVPSLRMLPRVAELIGVDAEWLVAGGWPLRSSSDVIREIDEDEVGAVGGGSLAMYVMPFAEGQALSASLAFAWFRQCT